MKSKSKHIKQQRRYQTLMKEEQKRARYEHNLAVQEWHETTENIMLLAHKPQPVNNYQLTSDKETVSLYLNSQQV
jgi:hypothetical protein